MLHDVIEARAVGGYRVFVRFDDGVQGEIDLSSFMIFEGVFAPLKTADRFAEVRVNPDLGTICWPNGADIAPEALYEALLHPPRLTTTP
jgi:hypothetical protein